LPRETALAANDSRSDRARLDRSRRSAPSPAQSGVGGAGGAGAAGSNPATWPSADPRGIVVVPIGSPPAAPAR
jgi:hypothetical protein